MVGTLLSFGPGEPSKEWYKETYRQLAEEGLRVIALAYGSVDHIDETVRPSLGCFHWQSLATTPREAYEKNLKFAGQPRLARLTVKGSWRSVACFGRTAEQLSRYNWLKKCDVIISHEVSCIS